MAVERRRHTEEFKREAVRLMETSGKPISRIARELGVNDNNLYRWRGQYGSQQPPSVNGNRASVVELEAEVKRLRQERDILKKAMSIVSRSQP